MRLASRLVPAVIAALVVATLTIGVVDAGTRPALGFPDVPTAMVRASTDPSQCGPAVAGVGSHPTGGAPAAVARRTLRPTGPGVGAAQAAQASAVSVSPTRFAPPPPAAAPVTVPILYYHRASSIPKGFASWSRHAKEHFLAYDVLPSALEAQLDWLVAHGYTTILPRDLAAYWDHGVPLPPKPVIISFDDGFHNWTSTVMPMLQARHMVAEFYLTIDAIRAHGISWPEVRQLAAAGNGIGAHDDHHVQLVNIGGGHPDASEATMWAEVTRVRDAIFAHTGVRPDSLAYVGGGYNKTLERVVQQAGYTTARTIVRGIVQAPAKRYAMRVVRVGPRDDVANLLAGTMVPGLPTFTARMAGVPDHTNF